MAKLQQSRIRVGIAPIGWVNDDLREWGAGTPGPRVMEEIAQAGYEGSEMSYAFPQEPSLLQESLGAHGLVLSAGYRWVNFANPETIEAEIAATNRHIDFCRAAGASVAIVAEGAFSQHWDLKGERAAATPLSPEQWTGLFYGLHACGQYARDRAMKLVVHPHGGTAVEKEAEIDHLLSGTDPELVGWCPDIAHIVYGGGDPVALLQRHGQRISYIHLKDVRREVLEQCRAEGLTFKEAVARNVFCTPGAGSLTWEPIFDTLAEAGYEGWLVVEAEQDPARYNAFEVSSAARRFIRKVAGV